MANASQGDNNHLTSKINPATNNFKTAMDQNSFQKVSDFQGSNISDSPDSGLKTGKTGSKSHRVRFKKQSTFDENKIIKELEQQVDTLIQDYCK